MIFNYLLVILLGLILGSFISCFSYRFPKNINFIKGNSFCPKCKKKICWFDNIPLLSFIFLKGKCRNCKKTISFRYPLIELTSALFFLLAYLKFQNNLLDFLIIGIFYLISISIVVIDIEEGIIPDELTILGFLITFLYLILFKNNLVFKNIFYGFLLSFFMLTIHLITKGKGMGLGDVKFTLFPASFLSYPLNLIWLFLSFVLGSIVGIFLIIFKKAKFGKPIPFGPFLATSFLIVLLWGKNLVELIIPLFKY